MLTINLEYDANALGAPQSFRDGVQAAANILDAAIYDPITVNIGVGYGDFDGMPLPDGPDNSVGGIISGIQVSYPLLTAALAADETSATDTEAVNSLPDTSALNGRSNFDIASAQAKALGVISATDAAIDGYVGFPSSFNGNGLIDAAIVEIAHAMGLLNVGTGGMLSLFQYTSPGVHLLTSGFTSSMPAYFSIDGGNTNLANYDVSFDDTLFLDLAHDPLSVPNTGSTVLTPLDLSEIGAIGFDVTSVPSLATPNITPLSTAGNVPAVVNVRNVMVGENKPISALSLITSVSAPSGDSIPYYGFRDEGGGNGHFEVNGVAEPDAQWIYALNTQLSVLQYIGGSSPGSELLDVVAFDYTADTFTQVAQLTATTTMSGSPRLAFFSNTVSADKVNVVLTSDGTDVAGKAIAGDYNIEVFTGTAGILASGFQGSAFIQGAIQLTNNAVETGSADSIEQLLDGSYTLIDLSATGPPNESIQVVGSAGGSADVVIGSAGDTIIGSPNAAVTQFIDASGTNPDANPGPFAGPEIVIGGAGGTTVTGGRGDSITGGAGAMQVNDGTLAGGETVKGGAGNLTVFSIGRKFSIAASTAGTTFVNDEYGKGGGSSIVGGSGGGALGGGENTEIFSAAGDKVTVGGALTYVDGSRGSISIQGGNGTNTGTVEGAANVNTNILAGKSDAITLDSATTYVNALSATGATVIGGAGKAHVDAGAGTSVMGGAGSVVVAPTAGAGTVTGGSGDLVVFDIGKAETVTGSTGGTTFINDAYGIGGNSKLTGGGGTVTGAGGQAANTVLIGAAGDTIVGGAGSTMINALLGAQSIAAGAGATTVQAGTGDMIAGGSGTLQVYLDSDQPTTTVNLGASHAAASLREISVAGGKGSTITVTGFAATDVVQSRTSVSSTNTFLGTSSSIGGNTTLTFLDGSTMLLAGVAAIGAIKFTQ